MRDHTDSVMRTAEAAGWKRWEIWFALGGALISALGSFAAAAAAIFSYQQLKFISDERMTPYRAVLYSSKLEAYKQITAAYNDLHGRSDMALTFYLTAKGGQMDEKSLKEIMDSRDRLAQVIDANSVVWPKPVYDLLNKHKASMLDVGSCLESASEFSSAKNTEAFKAVAIAAFCEYLDGPLHINTKEWRLTGEDMKRIAPTLFFNNDKVALTAMREDLRTDQLESIDSKK